jgi:hypothetical protein
VNYVAELSEASPAGAEQAAKLAAPAQGWQRIGERRRPCRMYAVSPELVPMLRGQGDPQVMASAGVSHEWDAFDSDDEGRRTGFGILIGVPIGVAMWAAIGLTLRWAFGF